MAFITSLRIKNFFSIKNEVTIDFKASPYNIENNPERLFEFNGEYYNKVISFYGANASGKTTVLKAISTLSKIIANEQSDYFISSFKNKFAKLEVSSEIEIFFVLNIKGIFKQFAYKLIFKSEGYENIAIGNEELYSISQKEILFNRQEEKIKNIDNNIIESLFESLSDKKSLINEFFKFDKTNQLFSIENFFINIAVASNIEIYNTQLGTDNFRYENIGVWLTNNQDNIALENFYLSFFKAIGLDIVKIEAKFKESDIKEKEFKGIDIFHSINLKEPLEIELESDGTQMLMKVWLDIYKAKILGAVLVLDELDSIVHPMLVPIIINLLIENDIQIIYSTHNIYNMKFLQNDEVFLIEKDKNHKTTIKAVKDMPDVKGYKNLLTLYENGYLGGVPKVEELITKIL